MSTSQDRIEAAATLALAGLAFADSQEWWGPAMVDWVAAFEPLDDIDTFEVTADAGLDRLRVRLGARAEAIAERSQPWFEHLQLDETTSMGSVATAIGAERGGCWLDLSGDDLLSGWDLDVPATTSIPVLLAALPATPSLRAVGRWCAEEQVTALHRVSFVAGSDGEAELTFSLPGDTADAQLGAALGLFERLSLPSLPDDAIGALALLGRPRFGVRVAVTRNGTAALGITSIDPDTKLVLRLCDVLGVGDDDTLAAFEGALGVEQRLMVSAVQAPTATCRVDYRVR